MSYLKTLNSRASPGMLVLIYYNLLSIIILGVYYPVIRITALLSTNPDTNPINLAFLYIAPHLLLLGGTIKLMQLVQTSREIYLGSFVIFFFSSQLFYILDLNLGGSFILLTSVLVPMLFINIYVLFIDAKSKSILNSLSYSPSETGDPDSE